jgi:hypothetical protein
VVIFIYIALTVAMGISALVKGAIYAGIAGIVGPTLCWFAASGLKGSLMVGTSRPKLVGLGAAIAFVAIGIGIVYHSGYWVGLFGYEFTGATWCVVGLVAGWISTTRQHADPRQEMPAAGAQERIISKPDADMIFAFARADWEQYVRQVGPPEGWTVRLMPHETGTALARFSQSTGMGVSVQPLYADDQGPPVMMTIGTYYPREVMRFTDASVKKIEHEARLDLGPAYSVSAKHAKIPDTDMAGIEIIVTHDTVDPRGPKGK